VRLIALVLQSGSGNNEEIGYLPKGRIDYAHTARADSVGTQVLEQSLILMRF
jgi:hypothetical protein